MIYSNPNTIKEKYNLKKGNRVINEVNKNNGSKNNNSNYKLKFDNYVNICRKLNKF